LEHLDRWLAQGHSAPHGLEQRRCILLQAQQSEEGFQALLQVLRDRSEDAVHLRGFDPFPVLWTAQGRRAAQPRSACHY
jgi:hypothetical protein